MPTTRNQAKSESESSKPPDSTAQSQHDTKTILFTKPTQIFDNVVLIPEPPNITADPRYTRLVASIQYLRRRLMQDEVLREPLLHVLKSLYKSATTKKKISLLRPIEPTHQDIIHFVDELWPDLYLVKPDQRLSSTGKSNQWDGVWGHTYSGVAAVPDARIQIIAPLIEQWQSHNVSYYPPSSLPHEALSWFTNSVYAHEATHRMVVWWSSGECDTPKMDGVDKEAGDYVERAWFGGVTVAEFPKGKVGVFNDMISVGVEITGDYYPIDLQLATQLQRMDTSHGLPLFKPKDPAPPLTPGTVRVKATRYATNEQQFHNANSNLIPSAGPSSSESTKPKAPVETVIWRHLTNDKIPYENRHLYGLM